MSNQIHDDEALEQALAADLFLLFKHSFRCSVSAHAFRQYEAFCRARPEVPSGWLDVVAQRPLAQRVAERTGIAHASPQALLLRAGAVAWHASHFDITRDRLEGAL